MKRERADSEHRRCRRQYQESKGLQAAIVGTSGGKLINAVRYIRLPVRKTAVKPQRIMIGSIGRVKKEEERRRGPGYSFFERLPLCLF